MSGGGVHMISFSWPTESPPSQWYIFKIQPRVTMMMCSAERLSISIDRYNRKHSLGLCKITQLHTAGANREAWTYHTWHNGRRVGWLRTEKDTQPWLKLGNRAFTPQPQVLRGKFSNACIATGLSFLHAYSGLHNVLQLCMHIQVQPKPYNYACIFTIWTKRHNACIFYGRNTCKCMHFFERERQLCMHSQEANKAI